MANSRGISESHPAKEPGDRDGWGLFYHPELTIPTPHPSVNLDNRMRRNTFLWSQPTFFLERTRE